MGTRVDFYIERGLQAEWLGSYPWDGYPSGVFGDYLRLWDKPKLSAFEWRGFVRDFLAVGGHQSTTPDLGWPWPWDDSRLTDFAYAWDDGIIYGACFGQSWFRLDPKQEFWGQPRDDEDDPTIKTCVFPTMRTADSPKATLGPRSGLIVLGTDFLKDKSR